MKAKWKLYRKDNLCSDKHLVALYETKEEAERNMTKDTILSPVDPLLIENPNDCDFSHYIYSLIPKEEIKRVFSSDARAEIIPHSLTCGNTMYYHLSRVIPKDWCVIDMGCSYNAQSYLFGKHWRHIAVDLPFDRYEADGLHLERFVAENTELYEMDGRKWLIEVFPTMDIDVDTTFCICNYVPNMELRMMVNRTFPNVFNIYPKMKFIT